MRRPARPAQPRDLLKVELRYAPLPLIGALAVHCWFVLHDANGRRRWEVWQTRNAGRFCIGHVHRDLKAPEADVGGGPSVLAAQWDGEDALKLARVLERAADYPHCERYRTWPGPNSNTFAAWVLRAAGIEHPLPWRAWGRNYQ